MTHGAKVICQISSVHIGEAFLSEREREHQMHTYSMIQCCQDWCSIWGRECPLTARSLKSRIPVQILLFFPPVFPTCFFFQVKISNALSSVWQGLTTGVPGHVLPSMFCDPWSEVTCSIPCRCGSEQCAIAAAYAAIYQHSTAAPPNHTL